MVGKGDWKDRLYFFKLLAKICLSVRKQGKNKDCLVKKQYFLKKSLRGGRIKAETDRGFLARKAVIAVFQALFQQRGIFYLL